MKNFLIIILLLIVAGLGLYIYTLQGNKLDKNTLTSLVEKAKSTVTEGLEKIEEKIPASSKSAVNLEAVKSLPDDTVLSVNFPFKSIKPAIDHLINTINKIKNSSIGKKLNIEDLIKQSVNPQLSATGQMALSDSADFSGDFENFEDKNFEDNRAAASNNSSRSLEESIKVIQEIESINFNLRTKVVEGRAAPMLNLSAKFSSDYLNKQIQPALDIASAQLNQQIPGSIKSNPADPESFNLEIKAPVSPVDIVGSVTNKNKELTVKLAALGSTVKAQPQFDSSVKNLIAESMLSNDSFWSYMNSENFIFMQQSIVDSISANNPQSAEIAAALDAFKALMKNYRGFASSAQFNNGFKSRSCVLLTDSSKNIEISKAAIKDRSASANDFIKLIAPRTTAAFSFKAASLISYLQGVLPEAADSDKNDSANIQLQAASEQINQSIDKVKALELLEIGIIANAPTVSFMPDYGLYIEHSGKHSLKDMANLLNDLMKSIAPPSLGFEQSLQITKNANGQEQIVVNLADYPLTLIALNDKVILGAGQPAFIQELSTLLSGQDAYISEDKLKAKNLDVKLAENDYQLFFSPSSLTSFARQFIPFLTMSVPDLQITDAEVNEALALLDFNLLLTSTSSLPSSNTVCSEGSASLF